MDPPPVALSKLTLGGKGSPLSPSLIYDVAHRLSLVEIDSSCLERLHSASKYSAPLQPPPSPQQQGKLLTSVEARAALVVLLNKLLQVQSKIRPFLPIFLAQVLNQGVELNLPVSEGDAGVNLAVVGSIYKFKELFSSLNDEQTTVATPGADGGGMDDRILPGGQGCSTEPQRVPVPGDFGLETTLKRLKASLSQASAGELGVTKDEVQILEGLSAASPGIAALSVHLSSALCVVADTVAGLSCEALQASIKAFELEVANEGFSYKLESEVASDMRLLLFGSKLVDAKKEIEDGGLFSSIPAVHGSVREDLRISSTRARIEVNSAGPTKKRTSSTLPIPLSSVATVTPLATSFFSLIFNLQRLASNSLRRLSECLQGIRNINATAEKVEKDELSILNFEEMCQKSVESFEQTLSEVFSKVATRNSSGVLLSTEAFNAVLETRKVLTWEAVAAMALLDIRERLLTGKGRADKSSVQEMVQNEDVNGTAVQVLEQNGGTNVIGERKGTKGKQGSEKKKKGTQEMVLGRGTDLVRKLLVGLQQQRCKLQSGAVSFAAWAEVLEEFFDPKDREFQSYLDNVKAILESNESRRVPKTPKGTRDFQPEQMAIRERAFGIIASVFKRHGAVALDTPVFELRETLMGKYGEDSKLIYDLADQGGEICSLRYDLTVPFARFLATHNIINMKRYHIARVYRRDNPSKGRFREFYQCDFDIAGHYTAMLPDFEVIEVLTELLDELDIGDYQVKLNHRRLLDGMLEICGVPQAKFRTICSAIDKLDKLPWEQVRKEMVEEKGLTAETADGIGTFVQKSGHPLVLLAELKQEGSPFLQHEGSTCALEELATLFGYLQAANCLHRIVFDLSLARGLDYYTGVIYEAVFKGTAQVGSIAAGGRYDNLVGMFSGKQVPAVGVSLGIERVFAIMESQNQKIRATQTEVLVVVLGDDMKVAIKLVKELWAGKIKAEFNCVAPPKFKKQLSYAIEQQIPWMVIVGQDELDKGVVRLQNVNTKNADEVPRVSLVSELQNRTGVTCRMELPSVVQ